MTVKKMIFVAIMAAVICVCSWITIPFTVPFTMQTFAVFCTVLLLGGKYGLLSIGVYILLGAVGVPVFSGFNGGIGHIIGPTGGYIVGFVFIGLCWLVFEGIIKNRFWMKVLVLSLGLVLCYLLGTIWFSVVMSTRGSDYSFWTVLTICVFPYILPDLAKMLLAIFIAGRVKKLIKLDV